MNQDHSAVPRVFANKSELQHHSINNQLSFSKRHRTPVLIFLVLIITLGVVGLFFLSQEYRQLKREALSNLASVADLKIRQIGNWNSERWGDAKQIQSTRMIQEIAAQYLINPTSQESARQLRQWMESYQHHDDYSWLALVDSKGKVAMSIPAEKSSLSSYHNKFIRQALSSSQIVKADIHADPDSPIQGIPEIHLSYWIPIISPTANTSKPIGVWVFQIDPAKYLFPLVQSWPTDS